VLDGIAARLQEADDAVAAMGMRGHLAAHAVGGVDDGFQLILVELLGAVRTTLAERAPLVAEPFLLVGIIAAIKEIVVLSAFERDDMPAEDLALQLGVLAGVVLALAIAALLVRRKEREPEEGDAATLRPAPSAP